MSFSVGGSQYSVSVVQCTDQRIREPEYFPASLYKHPCVIIKWISGRYLESCTGGSNFQVIDGIETVRLDLCAVVRSSKSPAVQREPRDSIQELGWLYRLTTILLLMCLYMWRVSPIMCSLGCLCSSVKEDGKSTDLLLFPLRHHLWLTEQSGRSSVIVMSIKWPRNIRWDVRIRGDEKRQVVLQNCKRPTYDTPRVLCDEVIGLKNGKENVHVKCDKFPSTWTAGIE